MASPVGRLRPLLVGAVAALVVLGALGLSAPGAHRPLPPAPGSAGARAELDDPAARLEVAPAYDPTGPLARAAPLPSTTSLDVLVGLAPSDPAGFAAYTAAVAVAGGPLYHQYLTAAEFADRFGPSAASEARAVQYFQGFGLRAVASPDGLLLTVTGPAAAVGAAFGTSFAQFEAPDGSPFFAHTTAASLPEIAPWSGVLGLGNSSPIGPAAVGEPAAAAGPLAGPCDGNPNELEPCQVWTAYDLADLIANGTDGAGTTIGIVDTYDGHEPQSELAGDLATFDADYDLPSPAVTWSYPVPTSGDLNATRTGWGLEEALDLEWAHAAAPGAAIDFAFSPNSGPGLYAAVDALVDGEAANVISLSWGEPDVGVFNAYSGPCASACNASTDGSYDLLDPVLELAAAEGITVFAASGDCGAADGTSGVSTNFPASDPYVTGVGGTVLNVSGSGAYGSESGWSGNTTGAVSPGCQNQGGSGGGWAPGPRPAWQVGPGLPTSPDRRGVPDVSLDAGTPVTIEYGGAEGAVLGTSVATPIWAGIAALADQHAGTPLGFLDPQLYRILAGPDYTTAFHDIGDGYNGYSAGVGWDPVTGIGTPVVGALVGLLSAQAFPESNLTTRLTASPGYGPAPLSVAFGVQVTGGSGSYPLEGVAFGDGNASDASDGRATHVYPAAGVYVAAGYAADASGNTSASPAIGIVVGGGGGLTVALAASDIAPSVGTVVTLTATASGGTGPYSYYFQFGDGATVNWSGEASVTHPYDAAGAFCAEVIVADSAHPVDGGTSAPVALDVGGAPRAACAVTLPPAPLRVSGGPSVERGTAPLTVNFTALAQGGAGAPYTFDWVFGDGTTGAGPNVSHVYAHPGAFDAVLTVTDANGTARTANWTIVATAPPATPSGLPPPTLLLVVVGAAIAAGALAVVVGARRRPTGADPPRGAVAPAVPPATPARRRS